MRMQSRTLKWRTSVRLIPSRRCLLSWRHRTSRARSNVAMTVQPVRPHHPHRHTQHGKRVNEGQRPNVLDAGEVDGFSISSPSVRFLDLLPAAEMICELAEISAGHSGFLLYLKARPSLGVPFLAHQWLSLIIFASVAGAFGMAIHRRSL